MTGIHKLPPADPTSTADSARCAQTPSDPGAAMDTTTNRDGLRPRTRGPFQLLALTTVRGAGQPVSWRQLGHHHDLESAVRARVEDVLAQLAANDGWLINAQHLIVGPGADGPSTVHSYVSEVGADPGDDKVPSPHNEAALRHWLLSAHSLPC